MDFLRNFHLSAKSLGAAIGAVLGIAVAFNKLPKEQAEAITLAVAPVLALFVPQQRSTDTPPAADSPTSEK